ncbi:hypothetical protein HDU92_008465 [Lobulomyces angularis]|nr:hypothetical protein HDU92_008465 [Lobulomyces angularis]
MDNIRNPGSQSKYLNEIKDAMNRGEIITHILNWKISNQGKDAGEEIRKAIYKFICNNTKTYIVDNNIGISITWIMPNSNVSSAYYYTNSIYNDRITANHVKIMLRNIVNNIKTHEEYQNITNKADYKNDWGISYLVTLPLGYDNNGPVGGGDI